MRASAQGEMLSLSFFFDLRTNASMKVSFHDFHRTGTISSKRTWRRNVTSKLRQDPPELKLWGFISGFMPVAKCSIHTFMPSFKGTVNQWLKQEIHFGEVTSVFGKNRYLYHFLWKTHRKKVNFLKRIIIPHNSFHTNIHCSLYTSTIILMAIPHNNNQIYTSGLRVPFIKLEDICKYGMPRSNCIWSWLGIMFIDINQSDLV